MVLTYFLNDFEMVPVLAGYGGERFISCPTEESVTASTVYVYPFKGIQN
jgi:hypothetical protein